MNVSAIIVTRGNVDLDPIYKSLPDAWEVVVWDNSGEQTRGWPEVRAYRVESDGWIELEPTPCDDLSVYGRYAAIEYASHDLIYVQDDDVIVSDPQAIVDAWLRERDRLVESHAQGFNAWGEHLVANMPQEFRHDGYTDSCLVGFGACFHRDAPDQAFALMIGAEDTDPPFFTEGWGEIFNRTCDVVFTTLTPRVLVDVPKQNLPYATDSTRMYRRPGHLDERTRMLHLARQVRDS